MSLSPSVCVVGHSRPGSRRTAATGARVCWPTWPTTQTTVLFSGRTVGRHGTQASGPGFRRGQVDRATAGRFLRSRRQPTGDLYNSRERVVVGQAVQVLQAVELDLSERAMPTENDTQKHSSASRSTHTGAPGPQKAEETPPQADAPRRPSTLRSTSAVEGRPTTPTTTGGLVSPPRKPTPDMPPL